MLYDELYTAKVIKQYDWSGWDTSVECKNWITAESLLDLNQKAFDSEFRWPESDEEHM
jgi:hypothetical protein